jgi:hypothetical protein
MNSESQSVLKQIDAALVRMLKGIVWFICHRIPELISELIREFREVVFRLARIAVLGGLWLAVTVGPLAVCWSHGLCSWAGVLGLTWTVLAITGSVWGLYRLAGDMAVPAWCKRLAKAGSRWAVARFASARKRMPQTQEVGAA